MLDSQKRSLEMVVSEAPLSDVLAYLARVVEEQSGGKAVASILLLDSDGLLRNGASPSLPGDYLKAIDGLKPDAEIGTCCAAAARDAVVLTPDIGADPKWQTLKHLPLELGFVAAWSQPIIASDGRALGTFGTYFRERREPTPFERQTVEIFARTAALAIERRRAEDERKLAEEARGKLASIVESSADAIISKDLNGIITSWNKGAERLFGHTAREAVGQSVTILIPAERINEEPKILERIRAGERLEHYETVRRRKDGTLLDISLTVSPISDDRGRIVGASKIARDITGRKRAQEALRASEERYRSLFESIDEGFCVIEMLFDSHQKPVDYRFLEVNPAFERQAGMHDVAGKRMLEFVSEIEPHWLENYARVALTGKPIRFAAEYKSLGSWFDVYAFRVGPMQGRRVAVLFNNITKRKQTEAELAAANEELALRARELDKTVEKRTAELRDTVQQLETFSYSIVHDMRAPLRSMRSFAGFLQDDYGPQLDGSAQDYLRRIMESAARMDALITDVLNYSRVSRGPTDWGRWTWIALCPRLSSNIRISRSRRTLFRSCVPSRGLMETPRFSRRCSRTCWGTP